MLLTGFHSIEEKLNSIEANKNVNVKDFTLYYSKPGPRVKKILEFAKKSGINSIQTADKELNSLVSSLPETARDHRGIVLLVSSESAPTVNSINFDEYIAQINLTSKKQLEQETSDEKKRTTVIILDSITDPHNTGAIIRSADQFGVDLVVLPERRSSKDSEVISRASSGAAAWVPFSIVPNLVRAVQQLKEAGFWIYGADAGGSPVQKINFPQKTAIIMGSEGNGISRLLNKQCDTIVSIPTCGKLDSLNVSVAAGILLYEITIRNSKDGV